MCWILRWILCYNSQKMVQIYDPVQTSTSNGFIRRLEEKMVPKYTLERRFNPDEISRDDPLLVLCQNYSRVVTDIKDATDDLSDIPDSKKAVIILHVKQESSLPIMKTKDTIFDENCKKFGLLVDFAYINGSIYPCKMNEEGSEILHRFLKNHCKPETERTNQKEQQSELERKIVASDGATSIDHNIAGSGDVQLYRHINSTLVDVFIKSTGIEGIPGLIEESSLTALDKNRCWIILCEKGSYVEKDILSASQTSNGKVLILLEKAKRGYEFKLDDGNALAIINMHYKTNDFSSMPVFLRQHIQDADIRFQQFFKCAERIVYRPQKDSGSSGCQLF